MIRSKKKELKRRLCGTPPLTPPESDDEDDEGLDEYGVEHTYSEILLDSSCVEQDISLLDKSVVKLEKVNKGTRLKLDTKTFVNRSGNNNVFDVDIIDAHQVIHFEQSYMQNDDFFLRNCYGGGKRKSNDSDVDYDPDDAKKVNRKKRKR